MFLKYAVIYNLCLIYRSFTFIDANKTFEEHKDMDLR